MALVLPTSASAATYTKAQVDMMVDSLEVTQAARQYISVTVLADCPGWGSDQARFFHGRRPKIEICAPKMDSPRDVQNTVHHEAIHLAQWCNGSDSFYDIDAMKKDDRKKWPGDIQWAHETASKYYKPSQYEAEFEAYYLMGNDPDYITKMVHGGCK